MNKNINFTSATYQKKSLPSAQGLQIIQFLTAAFDDYLASRVLINEGLLPQGAVLASTAMEKYLKAVMATKGNFSHGHLKKAHWESLKNYSKEIYDLCNIEFLQLCQHCYKLRYLDDLPLNFNIVIAAAEFINELDKTALVFESIIKLEKNEMRKYNFMINNKDPRLMKNNYQTEGLNLEPLNIINQPVYELRKCSNGQIITMEYVSTSNALNPSFLREGLITQDNKSFATAFNYPPRTE